MFFGIAFGCYINWQVTLIVLVPLIIMVILTFGEASLRVWQDKQNNKIVGRASTLAIEIIHNMRTIKQLSVEKEVLRQYSGLFYEAIRLYRMTMMPISLAGGMCWTLDVYTMTFVYWRALDDFHGDIKFVGVKFISPTRPTSVVLNKFQLNIMPKGQRVALVGGSGCGKSTTIQLLQRFYGVKKGQILLDGVDIRALNIHWVHSQFGLVSQEPILFDLTIADNIAYDLEDVSMTDIIDAAKKVSIHQFIEQLPDGYETKVGIKDSFLSGGEKQRVTIARVLIRRSKVLLLDEATSAMDSQNEQVQGGAKVDLQEALEQTQIEDPSRISLIIAHRLSTIRSCDSICVVDKGKIIESGTHTELIQRHRAYYRMLTESHQK
ncbi:unnamed protein product [Rotaria magnacalcarata]|uniref:Uncharacterized protein n=1 Tax=Rotaria magnacalcarata TaxID=392030 RepID=A0A8S2JT94_9BILA|nr:unnamed protein product [Rotaria magnacalcarata]CAF3833350.1 unnamed protein product [Rotaria magnacalcarata]